MEADIGNIRDILGVFVGDKVVDITQHDTEEWEKNRLSYVMLMFDSGGFLKFYINDLGFIYNHPTLDREPDENAG